MANGITSDESKIRLQNLILGILNSAGQVPKVKLAKLVLFSEIEYFNRKEDSYTGLYFVRLRKGPLIAFFDDILSACEEVLWVKKSEMIPIYEENRPKYQYSYIPLKPAELDKDIKETIEIVMKEYGKKTGTQLSHESHDLPAWKYSEPNEPIYVSELAAKSEAEYFALVDLIEDLDDEEEILEEDLPRIICPA